MRKLAWNLMVLWTVLELYRSVSHHCVSRGKGLRLALLSLNTKPRIETGLWSAQVFNFKHPIGGREPARKSAGAV